MPSSQRKVKQRALQAEKQRGSSDGIVKSRNLPRQHLKRPVSPTVLGRLCQKQGPNFNGKVGKAYTGD